MWSERATIGIPKPETEPTDTREMRVAIERAARDSSLVNSVFNVTRYSGLSGEDLYTTLAYYALRELENQHARSLEFLRREAAIL